MYKDFLSFHTILLTFNGFPVISFFVSEDFQRFLVISFDSTRFVGIVLPMEAGLTHKERANRHWHLLVVSQYRLFVRSRHKIYRRKPERACRNYEELLGISKNYVELLGITMNY